MKSGRMSVKSDFVSYLLGNLINGPVAINRHMVQNRDVLKRRTVKTHTTLNSFLYHSEVGRGSRDSPWVSDYSVSSNKALGKNTLSDGR